MAIVTYLVLLGALALVLVLIGGVVHLLRRYAGGWGTLGVAPRLKVVDRIALGQRQGLAVVRVGGRHIVVSVGEGGVRPIVELDADEGFELYPVAEEEGADRRSRGVDLGKPFRKLRRPLGAAALVMLAQLLVAATTASAQPVAAPPVAMAAVALQTQSQTGPAIPRLSIALGDGDESDLRLSGTVGTVVVIGLLTLLPTLLLLMTSFTRILVVLFLLRQAIGTQNAPPGHLVAALALLLTGFVMAPTLSAVNEQAVQPWLNGEFEEAAMLKQAVGPFRAFMLDHTRERDLALFLDLSGTGQVSEPDDVPLVVLASAFVTSELRAAFQIGFALFLPFIIIDLVVASVLMSMGMFMLPPVMVSLPFKLLLFVLVDGWSLIFQSLATSFQ